MEKIVIFHPAVAPYRVDLFNDIAKTFDASFFFDVKFDLFDYAKIEEKLNFSFKYLKPLFSFRGKQLCRGYLSALKRNKPELVLVSEYGIPTLLAICYRTFFNRNCKVVSFSDDSYDFIVNNNDFTLVHRIARRLVLPLLDDVILPDRRTVDWCMSHYHKGVFFPIIGDDFILRETYSRLLTDSYNAAKEYLIVDKNVFLFVGRLVELKNVDTIIDAFSHLNQKKNILVIIGDGECRESLRERADKNNANVLFLGRLENDDLYKWYNIADVLLLASYQEAFGAVTAEALTAGCRCLVSEKAGSACLINPQNNGNLFDPYNKDMLVQQLRDEETNLNNKDKKDYRILRKSLMPIKYKSILDSLFNRFSKM